MKALVLLSIVTLTSLAGWSFGGDPWDTRSFGDESTLEFLTIGSDEGAHWSRVWFVVIDGELYIRLAFQAAGRIEKNTAAPYVQVKIGRRKFDRVRVEPAPEMALRIADAMAEKYWSDMLVRYFPHPLTARLRPEPVPATGP